MRMLPVHCIIHVVAKATGWAATGASIKHLTKRDMCEEEGQVQGMVITQQASKSGHHTNHMGREHMRRGCEGRGRQTLREQQGPVDLGATLSKGGGEGYDVPEMEKKGTR